MADERDLRRPLRVLQLHNHQSALGGAMEVLEHERSLLTEAGHEVEQLTLPAAEDMGLPAVRAGAKAVWNREAEKATAAHAERFDADVVHVHTPFPLMSPSVFRGAKHAGVPTVATLHSFRYSCVAATCHRDGSICEDCVGRRVKWPAVAHRCYHDSVPGSSALALSLLVHRAAGTFRQHVDRYLPLTEFARDLLIRDGFPAEKILVKANSVPDPGAVGSPDLDRPYVFFAARLIDVKGVSTLLDAWRQVPDQGLRLLVAGDGEQRGLVEAAVDEDPRIELLGWLPEQRVTELMARAVVTVVPSEWYEAGPPLTLLRSLSVGTPVLASSLENISADLVPDGAGATFEVADAEDLARRIGSMTTDPAVTTSMRVRAREAYEGRYTPEVSLRRLEQVYGDLVTSARPR